jgi:hypothetical protein
MKHLCKFIWVGNYYYYYTMVDVLVFPPFECDWKCPSECDGNLKPETLMDYPGGPRQNRLKFKLGSWGCAFASWMAIFVKNQQAAFMKAALKQLPISGYSVVFSKPVFATVKHLKVRAILSCGDVVPSSNTQQQVPGEINRNTLNSVLENHIVPLMNFC